MRVLTIGRHCPLFTHECCPQRVLACARVCRTGTLSSQPVSAPSAATASTYSKFWHFAKCMIMTALFATGIQPCFQAKRAGPGVLPSNPPSRDVVINVTAMTMGIQHGEMKQLVRM